MVHLSIEDRRVHYLYIMMRSHVFFSKRKYISIHVALIGYIKEYIVNVNKIFL